MSEGGQERQVDVETLQAMYQALVDASNRLAVQVADLQGAIETLEVLERAGKDGMGPFLLPVGAFLMLRVPGALADRVLVNLGGNVYAEMEPGRAKEELTRMLEEARQELGRVQATLRQIEAQLTQAISQAGRGGR